MIAGIMLYLLVIFMIVIFAYSIFWYASIPKNLPPGPAGFPVVGSLLSLKIGSDDVTVLEKWAKIYGPLYKFYMGRKLVVVLANYDVIEQSLIKQGDIFSGRPNFSALYTDKFHNQRTGFLLTVGDMWREQRRFALSTLRDRGMGKSSLQQCIAETAELLLHEIETAASAQHGKSLDLVDLFNKAVGNVICLIVFGRTFDGDEFWRQLKLINFRVSESGVSFLSSVAYFPWIKKLPFFRKRYDRYFTALNSTLDFVQSLIGLTCKEFTNISQPENYVHSFLQSQQNKTGCYFTDNEMLASIAQIFAAGTDTTATTLRYGLYYLCQNPEVQQNIIEEIHREFGPDHRTLAWEDRLQLPYVEASLMEIQRMSNLLPLSLMHRTLADTHLMRYDIPADTLVIPFLWNVLKDPDHFREPEKFDPNRFLDAANKIQRIRSWIPFSTGKRICLGESLAKMELFVFFTALVMRFSFSFPADQPCSHIERSLGFLSHPKNYKINVKVRSQQ